MICFRKRGYVSETHHNQTLATNIPKNQRRGPMEKIQATVVEDGQMTAMIQVQIQTDNILMVKNNQDGGGQVRFVRKQKISWLLV